MAILVRVSTVSQETARQVSELQAYASSQGYEVVEVCEEHGVSGRANRDARTGLQRVEELARAGKIRKVLVHEISRVARRNSVAHAFVEALEDLGVSLFWHAQGLETLLPNGERNPAASIMLAVLAEFARNEVATLAARVRSGMAEARRKGVHIGRPKGPHLGPVEFLAKHRDVVRLLRAGHSIRNAAKISGKGPMTVQRIKRAMAIVDVSK